MIHTLAGVVENIRRNPPEAGVEVIFYLENCQRSLRYMRRYIRQKLPNMFLIKWQPDDQRLVLTKKNQKPDVPDYSEELA